MSDANNAQEEKIRTNVQRLRQAFEPLTVGLTPDVEPAVIYPLPSPAPATEDGHDD